MISKEEYEQVEKYLNGELSSADCAQVELRIKQDPTFAQEVAEHRSLLNSFRLYGNRLDVYEKLDAFHQEMETDSHFVQTSAFNHYGIKVFWKKHLATMAVAASVALITVFSALLTADYVRSVESQQLNYYRALKRDLDKIKRTQQTITNKPGIPTAPVLRRERYSATGFVVSPNGYLVTDYHVIEGADSLYIESTTNSLLRYKVKEVYSDPVSDLAILKITDSSFASFNRLPYTFKSDESDLGEAVYTLAFPREDIVYGEGSISSQTGFEGDTTSYQVSIPVNPGNSGGPLLDDKGHLIGIIKGKSVAEDGATFAVKSKYLIKLIHSIPKDSLPDPLSLPKTNRMKGLRRPEQIKQIQNLVFNVKVYH